MIKARNKKSNKCCSLEWRHMDTWSNFDWFHYQNAGHCFLLQKEKERLKKKTTQIFGNKTIYTNIYANIDQMFLWYLQMM